MQKKISLNAVEVEYTFRQSARARCLRLAIYPDGQFVVSAPRYVSSSAINRFIQEKARWILAKLAYFKSQTEGLGIRIKKGVFIQQKERALELARARLEHFNTFYGFSYNSVSIRNQKTRWGSCSRKGALSFSYKIVLLPEPLADYIIVHELCHLGEFNHSKEFWSLVSRALPDYAKHRQALKKVRFVR